MGRLNFLLIPSIFLLSSAFITYQMVNWKIKEDYTVHVSRGGEKLISFRGLKAEINFDKDHPEKSRITASVSSEPIVDHNEALRQAARKPDVLNVDSFPVITFESDSILRDGASYIAKGKLILKGISQKIQIPFSFENEVFKGFFVMDPKDFHMTNPNFEGRLQVRLNVPVTK